MFDFEKWVSEGFERIGIMFGIDEPENEKIYSKRFKKVYRWFGNKGVPAFLSIVSIVLLFWIFFRVYNNSGFEKTVVILLLVIIITLRGLKK